MHRNTQVHVSLGKDILYYNKLLKNKISEESYIKIIFGNELNLGCSFLWVQFITSKSITSTKKGGKSSVEFVAK